MKNNQIPYQEAKGGLRLYVRLTPKSANDAVIGLEVRQEAVCVRARVRAIADKGRANKALCKLIAKWLDIPPSTVVLDAGGTSRYKTLFLAGDFNDLKQRLTERLGELDMLS